MRPSAMAHFPRPSSGDPITHAKGRLEVPTHPIIPVPTPTPPPLPSSRTFSTTTRRHAPRPVSPPARRASNQGPHPVARPGRVQ